MVGDVALAVWRSTFGRPVVFLDRCPHRDHPLSTGRRTFTGHLVCDAHDWEFDADGRCLRTHKPRDRSLCAATAFPARDAGGLPARAQVMPVLDVLHGISGLGDGSERGLDLGLRTGFGDDELRLGPVKVFVDGSLLGETAAVTEAFCGGHSTGYFQENPEQMAVIVEDLIKMLDGIGNDYRHRRHPDSKHAGRVAGLLRRVADELEL